MTAKTVKVTALGESHSSFEIRAHQDELKFLQYFCEKLNEESNALSPCVELETEQDVIIVSPLEDKVTNNE